MEIRVDGEATILKNKSLTVTSSNVTITDDVFGSLQYEHQYVKINNTPCYIKSIDTSTRVASLTPESTIASGTYDVELGSVLNGYDGEVMVEIPEFWIRSWDEDDKQEVRVALTQIDSTWEHQPRILVSAYLNVMLNTVPTNFGYLSKLTRYSLVSICNTNTYCRGGSTSGSSSYDEYLSSDKFRTLLGKPATRLSLNVARTRARYTEKEILSYCEYKRCIYWLYVIEYANFNINLTYNSEKDSNGCSQGGLTGGSDSVIGSYHMYYTNYMPIIPNGYTNEFGNTTNIKTAKVTLPKNAAETSTVTYNIIVPRWRGIEGLSDVVGTIVDGIQIEATGEAQGNDMYIDTYITDDPTYYSTSGSANKKIAKVAYGTGAVKLYNLGTTAEILPISFFNATTELTDTYGFRYGSIDITSSLQGVNIGKLGRFSKENVITGSSYSEGFRTSSILE